MTKLELQNILQSSYDRNNWLSMLNQFFSEKELLKNPKKLELNKDLTSEAFELGNVITSDERIVSLYEVHINENVKIEKNKVGLRNLLKSHWKKADGAFVVFVQGNKWRFTFVSEIFKKDETGNYIKAETEPKRYTYILGEGETVNTAVQRFEKLLSSKSFLTDIADAFSVEKVTKEFFDKIAVLFTVLTGGDRKIKSKIESFKSRLELPSVDDKKLLQEFAVRLIGRIVFCWFLKKKSSKNGIPLIPDLILSKAAVIKNKNYYHTVLEKLFFETLNTKTEERKEEFTKGLYKDVPFLNGGLFEPGDDDFYKPSLINRVVIPDEWLLDLFEVLESFNFTIDENTSIDIELSVDPEMLGRIFENLLAEINPETGETARKSTGSYYTPRPIVEYMVDESLKQYLLTCLNANPTPGPSPMGRGDIPPLGRGDIPTLGRGDIPTLGRGEIPKLGRGEIPKLERGEIPSYVTTDSVTFKTLKPFTKENRKNQTEAEKILWEALRNKKLGCKFRRQQAIQKYIVDFVCLTEKLIIEVDGEYHESEEQKKLDSERIECFKSLGYNELRFGNEDVINQTEKVIEEIKYFITHRTSPTTSLQRREEYDAKKPLHRNDLSTNSPPQRGGAGGGVDKAVGEVLNQSDAAGGVDNPAHNVLNQKLQILFDYSKTENPFNEAETIRLIEAIDNVKILDPACGSGAFPIGILQKMLLILQKLDPDSKLWFDKMVASIDDKTLKEQIRSKFRKENLNFIRKFGLIQKCIYGVDIQTIAVELSKLRCFLTLVVEEEIDDAKYNRGIIPLPNLEFKFVAANTLIGLEKESHKISMFDESGFVNNLEKLRNEYFTSSGRDKEKIEEEFLKTQEEIAKLLIQSGETKGRSLQLVNWEPFEHKSSGWFDPKWMFGITDGFDIVIGNPPYGNFLSVLEIKILSKEFKNLKNGNKNSAIFFILKSDIFLKSFGINTFIVPKSLSYSNGWYNCANFLVNNLLVFVDCGKSFDNVLLEMVVFLKKKNVDQNYYNTGVFINEQFKEFKSINKKLFFENKILITAQSDSEYTLILKILKKFTNRYGEFVNIERGLNWQSKVKANLGKTPVYRGMQLNKYYLDTSTDFINLNKFNKHEYEYMLNPKILNQLALAHVQNPYPHFYLQAALDLDNKIVFETISCTFSKFPNVDLRFLLSINNSKLLSWLLYKFVFNNAIRSTRYDEIYISKLPVPNLIKIPQQPFITLVDEIITKKSRGEDTTDLENKIDVMVYKLYELTYEEVKIVDPEFWMSEEEYGAFRN